MSQNQGGLASPPCSSLQPPYKSIRWTNNFWILDQRQLPAKKTYLKITDTQSACRAIRTLAVRGAPLIGVVAALAVAHAARTGNTERRLISGIRKLASTRPTAVNLFIALDRMKMVVESGGTVKDIVREALDIWKEEQERSYNMASHGFKLVKKKATLGTYCNTGALAAPGIGTALGVIVNAHVSGKEIEVVVPETRPLLQGARLTTWELAQWNIPHTLITESALASYVSRLDAVFVGADRIVRNGDTANKVGTCGLAILCKHFDVPFYVVAPSTTVDDTLADGSSIPIEQRPASEVRRCSSEATAPRTAKVANPAFDVTPAGLISAIVTERGISTPPYAMES